MSLYKEYFVEEFENYLKTKHITIKDVKHYLRRETTTLLECKMKTNSGEQRALIRIVRVEERDSENEERAFKHVQLCASNSTCEIYDFYIGTKFFYSLMKHYAGGSLDRLVNNENLSRETCLLIAYQLLQAINTMHEKRIDHRDISEDNIFIDTYDKESGKIIVVLGDYEYSIHMDQISYRTNCSDFRVGKLAHRPPSHDKDGKDAFEVGSSGDIWCFEKLIFAPLMIILRIHHSLIVFC